MSRYNVKQIKHTFCYTPKLFQVLLLVLVSSRFSSLFILFYILRSIFCYSTWVLSEKHDVNVKSVAMNTLTAMKDMRRNGGKEIFAKRIFFKSR